MNATVRTHARQFRLPAVATAIACGVLALAACSTVKVKTRADAMTALGIESAETPQASAGPRLPLLAAFAQAGGDQLRLGRKLARKGDAVDAAAQYLKPAVDAYDLLNSADGAEPGQDAFQALLDVHNAALAGFAGLWSTDPRRLQPAPHVLEIDGESIHRNISTDSAFQKGYFDRFIAAAAIEDRGVVRRTRAGIGAPLVGIREQRPERSADMRFYPKRGLHTPVTLTMDSVERPSGTGQKTLVTFSLRNPLTEHSAGAGSRSLPLAADSSAQIALLLKGRNERGWGLSGFLRADERLKASGIYLIEPYDPERIPAPSRT